MSDLHDNDRRAVGARIRKEVLGASHVKPPQTPTIFDSLFQEFTEDFCWGNVWSRDGLSRKTRSMLNLAMLSSMGRWHEFEVHVRGALNKACPKRRSPRFCCRPVFMPASRSRRKACGAPRPWLRLAQRAINSGLRDTGHARDRTIA